MHVILANRWYPPQANGGVATYNCYLAHALVTLGHQVTVVTARSSTQEPAINLEEGVCVHRLLTQQLPYLHRMPLLGRYMRPLQQVQYSLQVERHLQKIEASDNPPDIIEFAEVNAEGWAYLHRRQKKRVIVRCHTPTFVLREYYSGTEMPYDTNWTTRLEKFCIRHADALTAPSRNMAETIARHTGVPVQSIAVVPNLLDTNQFTSNPDTSYKENEAIVLHVGRLDRTKGIEVLAKAIPGVMKRCPGVRFVYIGADRPTGDGGTWQQRLQKFFKQHDVSSYVTFTGALEQSDLINWYHRAALVVVPSMLYESFSYTTAQAMAAGLPVIATNTGGVPETVGDGGICVTPGDSEELKEAICRLLLDPSLRFSLSQKAIQRAQSFSSGLVVREVEQLYHSLIRSVA